MKFLCRNCKAKYQIADEKVAGRTLRMTCQQCGEPIVVRGPVRQATGRQAPMAAPTGIGTGPVASPLGADFAHQMAAPVPAAAAHEEWHVAIHDTPVGPMRRDEVARKIATGAIDRESLAWREGMDDWLAIRHIAELAVLFSPSGGVGAPPPPAAALSVPPPSARGDMAPIGGRNVVAVEDYATPDPDPELPAVAVATMAPVSAEAAPSGKQPGWAQMFALVSGGAFILAAGALLGVRVLAPTNQSPPPAAVAPTPAAPVATAEHAQAQAPKEPTGPSGNVIELDMQAIDGTSSSGSRKSNGSSASGADKKGKQQQLTAEQKEMLERMGGNLNQGGPSNLRAPTESSHPPPGATGQLTAEQLSAVVLNGRKNLQRCYETALRGANSNDTVRLDVDIQVSPAGNVTSVHTSGKGLPGMDDCITRTVKMWRFPMSGDATQTRFPVVFQPGA